MKLSIILGCLTLLGLRAKASPQVTPIPQAVVQSGPRGAVTKLIVSPDGKLLASLSEEALQVWTRGGALLWSRSLERKQIALAWSPDSSSLAVGWGGYTAYEERPARDTAGAIELDAHNGSARRELLFGTDPAETLKYLPDGRLVAASGESSVVWDAQNHHQPYKSPPSKPGFSFDGITLRLLDAAGKTKRAVKVFHADFNPKDPPWIPRDCILAPDGSFYVARTDFPSAKQDDSDQDNFGKPRSFLWHVTPGGTVQTLVNGAPRALLTLALWSDGTLITGGASGDDAAVWTGQLSFSRVQAGTIKTLWSAPPAVQAVNCLRVFLDGKLLAVGGNDTAIQLWDLSSGRLKTTLKHLSSGITALDFSPDGSQLAALDYYSLFVWDLAHQTVRKFPGTQSYETMAVSLAWSPDGRTIAIGGGVEVKMWDAKTGKEKPWGADASAPLLWTGNTLWSGSGLYGPFTSHDSTTGAVRHELNAAGPASEEGHEGGVVDFQFFSKGQKLWTLGGDTRTGRNLKRWDVARDRVERTLAVRSPRALALSPDESTLVVGTDSGVEAYDSSTLSPLWKTDPGSSINDLLWTGDGQSLICAGEDGWIYVLNSRGETTRRFLALPALKADATGREWFSVDADGTFLSSPLAGKNVRWLEDGKLLSLEARSAQKRESLTSLAQVPSPINPIPLPTVVTAPTPTVPTPTVPTPTAKPLARPTISGPVLVMQGSAPTEPNAAAVSNGGRWLAVGAPLTFLDGQSGLQWSNPGSETAEPLLFTPDGRHLFVSQPDYGSGIGNRVQMVEVPSGKAVRSFALPFGPLWTDGKRLRGISGTDLVDFDLASGKRITKRPIPGLPHDKNVQALVAFSANGAWIIEGSHGIIRFWRASDGKLVGQIKDRLRAINLTAISNDGKWLASEGDDPGWTPPNDAASEAAYARNLRIHVWNALTKKVIRTFPGYYSLDGGAKLLRFSTDGKTLFGSGAQQPLLRTDWATDKSFVIPKSGSPYLTSTQWPLGLSPDGLFMGGASALGIWNTGNAKRKTAFPGPFHAAAEVKWSPNGKFLAGGSHLMVWDAVTGRLIAEKPNSYLETFHWVSDDLLRSASLQYINEWRMPDGIQLSQRLLSKPTTDELFGSYTDGAIFSPDGKTFLTGDPQGGFGGSGRGLFVRDVKTFAVLKSIEIAGEDFSDLRKMAWLPDSQSVLKGNQTGFELIDLKNGTRVKQWADPLAPASKTRNNIDALFQPLAVSGDGKLAVVRSTRDNSLLVFDLETQAFKTQLLTKAGYHATFFKDNRTVLVAGASGMELWDARGDGQAPLRVIEGIHSDTWNLSPNEKLLANTGQNKIEIWNLSQGKKVLIIYAVGPDLGPNSQQKSALDWIALTPQGYYDASPEGEKRLRWREGDAFWPLEKSHALFKRPDIVAQALRP